MSRKGLFFALAAGLAAFPASTPANAGPVLAGFALQAANAAIDNVGYYDSGYDGGSYGSYYGNGLLDIPAAVLGGAFGIVTGAFDSAFYDSTSYGYPYNGSQYYGDQGYSDEYNGSGYYGSGSYDRGYYDSNYDNGYYNNGYYGNGYYGGR